MNHFFKYIIASLSILFLIQCGGTSASSEEGAGAIQIQHSDYKRITNNINFGDDLEWGYFMRNEFETQDIDGLPIPVFAANFTDNEEEIIEEAIDLANDKMGYPIFKLIDQFSTKARIIYKVSEISFEEDDRKDSISSFNNVIGYTYTKTAFKEDFFQAGPEAGRLVVDWAMELKEGKIDTMIVAHELGHAMGIHHHEKINYDTGDLEKLDQSDLMNAKLPVSPSLDQYGYMMERQAEILIDHLIKKGATL